MQIYTETEKLSLGKERPLVLLNLCLPRLKDDKASKGFTAYYKALRQGFLQFAEGTLQKKAAAAQGEGFKPYGAVLSSVIALDSDKAASVYVDAAVTVGDKRRVRRVSQLWRKDIGTIVKAAEFFEKGFAKRLMPLLVKAAEEYAQKTGASLYADWEIGIKKHFNKERFYISPKGVVFYYQPGELSPMPKPIPLHLLMETVSPLLKPQPARLLLWEE